MHNGILEDDTNQQALYNTLWLSSAQHILTDNCKCLGSCR